MSYSPITPIQSDIQATNVIAKKNEHLTFDYATTLNNITEYDCVFRSKKDVHIYKTGYIATDANTIISGNLNSLLNDRYNIQSILPEHWGNPNINNNTKIQCQTHNVYTTNYSTDIKKSTGKTVIQSTCDGHSLPISSYSASEIAKESRLTTIQNNISVLTNRSNIEFKMLFKHSTITPKEINYLISSLNELINSRNNSSKYQNVYNIEHGAPLLQTMAEINESRVVSAKPSDAAIIRQINELNQYIGKLQSNDSYNNMYKYDQYPNNKIDTSKDITKKYIRTTLLQEFSTAILQDMQDCICYSDCNGYSVCWCYGNCNYY